MSKVEHNKLVRDRIPEIIKKNGAVPEYRVADVREYEHLLDNKILEEVHEYLESGSIEELADILEVVDAICESRGSSFNECLKIKSDKRNARGAFTKRIVLISTTEN